MAVKRISELEDLLVEIIQFEWKKKIKKNEQNLRDLWDKTKCTNINVIGVWEERTEWRGKQNIWKSTVWKFLNFDLKKLIYKYKKLNKP